MKADAVQDEAGVAVEIEVKIDETEEVRGAMSEVLEDIVAEVAVREGLAISHPSQPPHSLENLLRCAPMITRVDTVL